MNEMSCLKVRMAIDTNVTAPVNITGAPVTNIVANHAQKPEKFNRQNFKRWQQKMFFYLTTLNLARFLNETAPQVEPPVEAMVSNVIAMIYEVNLVGSNNSGWWVDTGATRHVCADKSMFRSFRAVDNREKLYMGNSATTDIKGKGDVILKMTSEKELKLTKVLYVLEIRKNLVSGWLLNKFGFRHVFESDKFVLSKNQMYIGKGDAVNGMFKLNVMVVKNDINKMNSSAYLIESSNVWHGRLRHDMWGEAILMATYLLNKIPHKEKEETPYELSSRLDEEFVQDKRQRDDNDLHDERQDQLEEEEVELRISKRARTEKSFGRNFVSFMVENEHTSYREAVTSSKGHQWKEAIKSKIDSILQNRTWEFMDLPPRCNY
ncbi:pol polyprotein [Tanacetum coccineum]|uniref:Pol polyprotein n=1 Tax=Tanacetum coccineum TaxID=301880 RepID=A0ABQ4WKD6_9ASTR